MMSLMLPSTFLQLKNLLLNDVVEGLYLLNLSVTSLNIYVPLDRWQLINKLLPLPSTSNVLGLGCSTPFITSSKITS